MSDQVFPEGQAPDPVATHQTVEDLQAQLAQANQALADAQAQVAAENPGNADAAAAEPSVQDLLKQLIEAQGNLAVSQQQHRAEVHALRNEMAKQRIAVPQVMDQQKTPEELLEARMADIRTHSHYCPGCGNLSTYIRECRGRGEAPHPPIEMVSTEELLSGDPESHTPAPATVNLG